MAMMPRAQDLVIPGGTAGWRVARCQRLRVDMELLLRRWRMSKWRLQGWGNKSIEFSLDVASIMKIPAFLSVKLYDISCSP